MAESQGFGAAGAALETRLSPTDCWGLPGAPSPGRITRMIGEYEARSTNY